MAAKASGGEEGTNDLENVRVPSHDGHYRAPTQDKGAGNDGLSVTLPDSPRRPTPKMLAMADKMGDIALAHAAIRRSGVPFIARPVSTRAR